MAENRTPRRHVAGIVAAVIAVLVVGAAGFVFTRQASPPATSSASTSAEPMTPQGAASAVPAPSLDRTAQLRDWASSVCIARDEVVNQVSAFGMDLALDPTSAVPLTDQFQQQLEPHLADIDTAVANLGTALGAAPMDYAEVAAVAITFEAGRGELVAGGQRVLSELQLAQDAPDLLAAGGALVQAGIAAKETYEVGAELVADLDALTKDSRGELGAAFDAAPACNS